MVTKLKLCTGYCAEYKTLDCFSKQAKGKDGLRAMCKTCRVRYNREHKEGNKWKHLTDQQFSLYQNNLKRLQEIVPIAKKQGRLWSHPTRLIGGMEDMKAGLILERYAEGGLHEGWCLHVRLSGRFEVFPLASYKYTTLALHLAEKDIEIL